MLLRKFTRRCVLPWRRKPVRDEEDSELSLNERKREADELTKAAVEAAASADASQVCPSFDDFSAEGSQYFALDLIEGCRVITTRPLGRFLGGDCLVSHTLNLGTYPSLGSQASLLKALFQSSQGESIGAQGGHNWSTLCKWSNGPQSLIASYSSKSESVETRAATQIGKATSVRCGLISGQLWSHIVHLGKSIVNGDILGGIESIDTSNDLAMAIVERATPRCTFTSKITYQGSPIGTMSLAARIHQRMWAGGDISWMSASGAILNNYGIKYKGENTILAAFLGATPNFNKPVEEGLKERVYTSRLTCAHKINERVSVGGEVEMGRDLQSLNAKLGYEVSFHQARVLGCIDSDYRLRTTVEDASGLQLSGELDFANDNFKFGFGFELSPNAV